MDLGFAKLWADLLDQNVVRLTGANSSNAAHGKREGIKARYIFMIELCMSLDQSFERLGQALSITIADTNFILESKVTDEEDGATLWSTVGLPKFGDAEIQSMSRENPEEFSKFGMCALFRELSKVSRDLDLADSSRGSPQTYEYYFAYIQTVTAQEEFKRAAPTLYPFQQELSKIRNDIDDIIAHINERVTHSNESFNEHATKITMELANLEKRISGAQNTYESFKSEISEKLKLKGAGDLWTARSTINLKSFRISITITAVILVATAAFIVFRHNDIATYLSEIGSKQTANPDTIAGIIGQVRQLIFVTVPLVVIVWLARFGMRYSLRALSLHDDAVQREVMLDTYLFLTGKGQAQEEHRALMLNALFRPLPGQAIQDVEPPNWAELMSASKDR